MKRIDTRKQKHKHIAKKLMASALALTICAPYIADGITNIHTAIIANAGYLNKVQFQNLWVLIFLHSLSLIYIKINIKILQT